MPAPKLNRGKMIKAEQLFDMLYKPSELAEELGVSTETLYRSYIPAGAPITRQGGNIWINGQAFYKWAAQSVATTRRGKIKRELAPGEGYCLRCNQVVAMENLSRRPHSRRLNIVQVSGICPVCGAKVNRLVKESAS